MSLVLPFFSDKTRKLNRVIPVHRKQVLKKLLLGVVNKDDLTIVFMSHLSIKKNHFSFFLSETPSFGNYLFPPTHERTLTYKGGT